MPSFGPFGRGGCPADCSFWAGDEVQYRDRRDGHPWNPRGRVVGPSNLAQTPADETAGERVLREALYATVGGQARVIVEGMDAIFGGTVDMAVTKLKHAGPCPTPFAPGDEAVLAWAVLPLAGAILEPGERVRVTGIAPSGVITVQAPDGRSGETVRSRLHKT